MHGEKLGGVWSALSKENKPHNTIYHLQIPNSNPPQYEHCSKRMAQLACDYHETLQRSGPANQLDPEGNNRQLNNILNKIPNTQKLENPDQTEMNWPITQDQVLRALHITKNGTATGLDGCPYKLWKTLNN